MGYKILSAERGCNTASLTRVTDNGALVALFLSYNDAVEYIKRKTSGKEAQK